MAPPRPTHGFQRFWRRSTTRTDAKTPHAPGAALPTLWLLGKTGAGKSTLIRALTGQTDIALGRGFKPCTQTAQIYAFPADKPLVAFLDTRGLGEAHYDASADMAVCQAHSHALLILMRAHDAEQSHVLHALRQIKRAGNIRNALLVHTAVESIASPHERARTLQTRHAQVQSVWGTIASVAVDFHGYNGQVTGLDALIDHGLALARQVARHYHPDNAQAHWAVTPLEALAVAEALSRRYRHWLHTWAPGAQHVHIARWMWLDAQVSRLEPWFKLYGVWRKARMISPAGLLAEVRSRFLDHVFDGVADDVQLKLKTLLLRDAIYAAIDLYGGHYRHADAPLVPSPVPPRAQSARR